ncbi:MAG: hypothetical protein KIT83_02055 [Bryobacterales bacterium]|nr:hypothetical protein [Bryobacterales bacterium]
MSEWSNPGIPPGTGFHKPRTKSCGNLFSANLLFGSLFILIGSILLLDRMGYVDSRMIFQYWPAALVAAGISMLLRRDRQAVVGGSVLTVIGGILMARRLGLTDLGLRDLWPIILIAIGALVLYNSLRVRSAPALAASGDRGNPDVLSDGAFFGGVEKKVESQNFQGGEATAIFGGVDVNLRRAKLAKGQPAVLNANAIFGGIELHVPEDWHVITEGVAILGGFADSRRFVESREELPLELRPTLIVRGIAVFGGVDIKN